MKGTKEPGISQISWESRQRDFLEQTVGAGGRGEKGRFRLRKMNGKKAVDRG